jgi:hypothetical protein
MAPGGSLRHARAPTISALLAARLDTLPSTERVIDIAR